MAEIFRQGLVEGEKQVRGDENYDDGDDDDDDDSYDEGEKQVRDDENYEEWEFDDRIAF